MLIGDDLLMHIDFKFEFELKLELIFGKIVNRIEQRAMSWLYRMVIYATRAKFRLAFLPLL